MTNKSDLVRLHKAIADAGVTSRRKAESLIEEGEVKVNGEVVTQLGTKVDTFLDVIEVSGEVVKCNVVDKIYMVMNKPRGYVTTVSDPEGRPTVLDLCSGINTRVFPIGRLDYHSEGLLLMTNDGELANKVMHPKYRVTKVYEVKVFGVVPNELINKLRKGFRFEDGLCKPKSVRVIKFLRNKTWLEFRLQEGKNREIRRLCEACGLTIDKLKRIAIEGLSINGIAPGKWNLITKKQLYKKLGFNQNGEPLPERPEYRSPKKSAKKSRKRGSFLRADRKEYYAYRKENYQGTMQRRKSQARDVDGNRADPFNS